MLGRRARTWGAFLFFLDMAVAMVCFLAAFWVKRHLVFADPALKLRLYLGLLALEIPFVMAVFALNGLYSSRHLLAGPGSRVRAILKAALQAFVVFVVVSFYAKPFDHPPSRAVFAIFFLFLVPGLILTRIALFACGKALTRSAQVTRRVLVFGSLKSRGELGRTLGSSSFEIVEVAGAEGMRLSEAMAKIEQGRVDCVVIDLPLEKIRTIVQLANRAEKEGVGVYITPRVIPNTMLHLSWEMVGDTPLIALNPADLPLAGRLAKRAVDLVLSLLSLIVLAPVMVLLGLLTKLTSRGPVFYVQRRVGLDGREFTMIKFRTMRADAEKDSGPTWTRPDDQRRTRLGALLRRANLDELPQLFNVLVGSMSLVGPRPERPEFVKQFKAEIERYSHKHWVRPGITGWAQVNGWRGNTNLAERIRHDVYYIEHWSLWLDFKILFMTIVRGYRNAF